MYWRLLVVLWLCVPGLVEAACSGSSPTRTAASAAQTDVNDCVTAATSGDTILVPSGSATWSSRLALPAAKDLTLLGHGGTEALTCTGTPGTSGYSCTATASPTTLTCSNGCFGLNLAAQHRLSGFTMTNSGAAELISCSTGNQAPSKHFRVDHNVLISTGGWAPIRCFGGSDGVHPQGIWDHNRVTDVAMHTNGTNWNLDDSAPGGNAQHVIWAKEPAYGGSTEVVYVEANYIVSSDTNTTDGNYGCRRVERFNTFADPGTWSFEVHGMQGLNRGCQQAEIYHNYVGGSGGGFSELRGGTGYYFNNTAVAGVNNGISLTIDRSEYDEGAGNFGEVRECGTGGADGNSPSGVDQQTGGQNGWRCRDQVGISYDATQWSHSPQGSPTSFGAWNQVQRPVYFWNNVHGGSAMELGINTQGDIENKLVVSREFFCDDGTSIGACNNGMRIGTISAIPSTCTVGMGYWATDEGEWNSLSGGADGRLYTCTSTDTWTLTYTPYTYPHPWTGAAAAEPVPTILRVIR